MPIVKPTGKYFCKKHKVEITRIAKLDSPYEEWICPKGHKPTTALVSNQS